MGMAARFPHPWQSGPVRPSGHRHTSQIGGAVLQVQNAPAHDEARERPGQDQDTLRIRPDGAMGPLVGGQSADITPVVIGEVKAGEAEKEIHSTQRSSFSCMQPAHPLCEHASGDVLRRGVDQAQQVCAVMDGRLHLPLSECCGDLDGSS
jgi:hypothetical protein